MSSALIVAGGGFQGLPVLRSLRALGWTAIIADSVASSPNRFEADHFLHVPPLRNEDAFLAAFLGAIKRFGVTAVFGTTGYDLPVLARLKHKIERGGVRVFVSDPALMDLLSDKAATYEAARRAGIAVLPDEDPLRWPSGESLIAKPRTGWGGRAIQHFSSRPTEAVMAEFPASAFIWQRALANFTEWSVDFAIATDGTVSPLLVRRRIRVSGGFAVVTSVEQMPAVENAARNVTDWLARSGGLGLFNVQFLEEHGGEHDGKLWLSDLNPRPGTSSVSAQLAGTNLVAHLLGQRSNLPQPGLVVRSLQDRFYPDRFTGVNGVVFDLDETIICQKSWMIAKAGIVLADLQRRLGAEAVTALSSALLPLIDEGPWDRMLDLAVARAGLPQIFVADLITAWRAARPDTVTVHPDAAALITALKERGIPFAIVTDNPTSSQEQKLAALPSDLSPDAVIYTDKLKAPKPSPVGFTEAAGDLGLQPATLLMIGDSPWRDAEGALAAGYNACVLVQRRGSMTNAQSALYERHRPDQAKRVIWLDSLFGLIHLICAESPR